MKKRQIAANARKTKFEAETRDVRGMALDLLEVMGYLQAVEKAFQVTIRDLEKLAGKWEQAAKDNQDRKFGADIVRASDAAEVCAGRVLDIIAEAKHALDKADESDNKETA